jgi:hypothetical protein
MEDELIRRLRRNQNLQTLPDGREAVDVTVQFLGEVPEVPRPERKRWLRDHFDRVVEQVPADKLAVQPDSISVSAQTIKALVPVNELDAVQATLADSNHRLDIDAPRQLTDASPDHD